MNKVKPKVNSLDVLIANLADTFSKIPNFDLLQTDSMGSQLFNMVTFRLADISSYKELVIHHFVPETNRAIAASKQTVRSSKFVAYLNISDSEYQETLFQTVRLAYVGLFHKMESFLNDILSMSTIFSQGVILDENLEKYAKREFGFQFRDWQQFSATAKINWISNCVKHYDGFPRKVPRPVDCYHFGDDQRLALTAAEFKNDTEIFLAFCTVYMTIMFVMTSVRIHEKDFDPEFWKGSPDMIASHDKSVLEMKEIVRNMIDRIG